MSIDELLEQAGIDVTALPPAPTPTRARWPDLCTGHGTAMLTPSPRMPATTAGILADLRAALAQTARP